LVELPVVLAVEPRPAHDPMAPSGYGASLRAQPRKFLATTAEITTFMSHYIDPLAPNKKPVGAPAQLEAELDVFVEEQVRLVAETSDTAAMVQRLNEEEQAIVGTPNCRRPNRSVAASPRL
jgi:hypothetical protein